MLTTVDYFSVQNAGNGPDVSAQSRNRVRLAGAGVQERPRLKGIGSAYT
jgi:hypothetical protein